jgi:predicted nucleotidyltransferase
MLPNGFNARVVNTFYLLQGKFHAFITRGQTNTNDYQDLVFLITQYQMDMPQYSSHIDKAYRLKFLEKYVETNAGNTLFIEWMRQRLGLAEGQRQLAPS